MDKNHSSASGGVVNFQDFRRKKIEEEHLARGRKPLYVSHSRGQVQGEGQAKPDEKLSDFSDRIARIRHSLDKINELMGDLKQISSGQVRGSAQKGEAGIHPKI